MPGSDLNGLFHWLIPAVNQTGSPSLARDGLFVILFLSCIVYILYKWKCFNVCNMENMRINNVQLNYTRLAGLMGDYRLHN